jgi:hypothetical protein
VEDRRGSEFTEEILHYHGGEPVHRAVQSISSTTMKLRVLREFNNKRGYFLCIHINSQVYLYKKLMIT